MRFIINWILDMVRPLDFGEFGVMMRDEETGELRPMLGADFTALEQESEEALKNFFFQKEAEAFAIYGEAIVRPQ